MKKIRVLEAIRQGNVGGGESHVYDLSIRLDRNKFEPIVLSFTDGPMVENLRNKGIETHVIYSPYPFDPRVYSRVTKLIKDQNIELIHAHGTRAASNLLFPARRNKLNLLYSIHGWSYNDNQSAIKRLIRISGEKLITRSTALNICVSESNLKTGQKAIPGFKAAVINYGIALDKFNDSVENSTQIQELGKTADNILVGLVARITHQKDPLNLVRAFHIAQAKNPKLKLIIIGQGELEAAVQASIREFKLEEKVSIFPFRADVPAILKTLDIYCLPSLWEGLPIGLLEAMAMGKAIIASDVDGTREVITPQTGILIQKENPEQLAEKILLLAGDIELRKKLGSNARELALGRFEVTGMVKAIESAYLRVLGLS